MIVIVGGCPGAGKTTLARRLAVELKLPLLIRDEIKEALFEFLPPPDRPSSKQLGRASYAVLFVVLDRLVEAGVGAVVESNFRRGLAEPDLEPRVSRVPAVLVHCETAREELLRRYRGRERHPGHHDAAALADVIEDLDAGLFEPLELNLPVLVVNTSDGYRPRLEEIVAFASGYA